jgi:hypothetical protein
MARSLSETEREGSIFVFGFLPSVDSLTRFFQFESRLAIYSQPLRIEILSRMTRREWIALPPRAPKPRKSWERKFATSSRCSRSGNRPGIGSSRFASFSPFFPRILPVVVTVAVQCPILAMCPIARPKGVTRWRGG